MTIPDSSQYLPTLYQQFIAMSRYSRWRDDLGRRESWPETVDRYFQFFRKRHTVDGKITPELDKALADCQEAVLRLDVLPSMRGLMTAGKALERDHVSLYNCLFGAIDHPHVFDEILFVLCNGTGAGFSVEKADVDKLPEIPHEMHPTDTVIVVADSKIGWATALRELITMLYAGKVPKWDVSRVRPAGARLKTFGGRASGPEPLVELFRFVVEVFTRAAGRKLKPIECHDIVCKIADIVVVGGVRRSALLSLSDASDPDMRHAKSGQWWESNVQRALANNSLVYESKPDIGSFMEEWLSLYRSGSGERGIFNRQAAKRYIANLPGRDPNHKFGTNPCCVPGDTLILTDKGNIPIGDLVGKPVVVWNGIQWSEVVPFYAGKHPVGRVELNTGASLYCTANHKWILEGGERVEASALKVGDRLKGYYAPHQWELLDGAIVGNLTRLPREGGFVPTVEVIEVGKFCSIESVYCFEDPANASGTFNNIVTGQSEILLRSSQFCNLTSVQIAPEDTLETLREKVRIATILGTIQSALTDFRYLRKIYKKNCEEERLLGVSLSGICDHAIMSDVSNPLLPVWLENLRDYAREVNAQFAEMIGINPSAAITCGKPEGTTSQLSNRASGVHPRYSKYYIRTVRNDKKDPLSRLMVDSGIPVEDDVTKPHSTNVFSFPIESPDDSLFRDDLNAIGQLELWLMYKKHWAEHTISCTIYVREHEWLEVGAWVYAHLDDITGVSFLPHSDHVYKQAPYQEITREQYLEAIEKMPKSIDWSALSLYEKDDETVGAQTLACTGGACEIP
mgnify:CR=1 FL=1